MNDRPGGILDRVAFAQLTDPYAIGARRRQFPAHFFAQRRKFARTLGLNCGPCAPTIPRMSRPDPLRPLRRLRPRLQPRGHPVGRLRAGDGLWRGLRRPLAPLQRRGGAAADGTWRCSSSSRTASRRGAVAAGGGGPGGRGLSGTSPRVTRRGAGRFCRAASSWRRRCSGRGSFSCASWPATPRSHGHGPTRSTSSTPSASSPRSRSPSGGASTCRPRPPRARQGVAPRDGRRDTVLPRGQRHRGPRRHALPRPLARRGPRARPLPTAHILLRLRMWHPVAAVVVGGGSSASCGRSAKRSPRPSPARWRGCSQRCSSRSSGSAWPRVAARARARLAHLLVADTLWVVLVFFAAAALSPPAREESAQTVTGRSR